MGAGIRRLSTALAPGMLAGASAAVLVLATAAIRAQAPQAPAPAGRPGPAPASSATRPDAPGARAESLGTAAGRTQEITAEQKERIDRLFYRVICDCPDENWSRTLAQCSAGCADKQKDQVRRAVLSGLSDEQVLAQQLQDHGGDERVLAVPRSIWAFLANAIPYLIVAGLGVAVVVLLRRSVRRGGGDGPSAPSAGGRQSGARAASPASSGRGASPTARAPESAEERRLGDAVEQDLEEMDR